MSIKKNLYYSAALTFSTYLVPLVVFPYISRVLGPNRIGAIDTIDNLIDYGVLFSMMGMSALGIREVAMKKGDKQALQEAFSSLFCLHALTTLFMLAMLYVATLLWPLLQQREALLAVGSIKLTANLFLIEWFYRGLEDFKYITIRSVIVRILFIVSVFLFVRTQEDYILYYALFVGIVALNAICNWIHKGSLAHLSFHDIHLRKYSKPFFALGLFAVLSAIYTKLSLPILNYLCGDAEAGYYATANRMFQVVIALISSLISVLIPRMSVLVKEQKTEEIQQLYNKTFRLLFFFAIPIIIYIDIFAKDIIDLIAGKAFEPAIVPLRIIMNLILIVGAEQIIVMQMLIPLKQDATVVRSALCGALTWAVLSVFVVSTYQARGTACVWVATEMVVLGCAARKIKRLYGFSLPWASFGRNCIMGIPYLVAGCCAYAYINHLLMRLICSCILFAAYGFYLWRKERI